jgi:hypothetical protein
MINDPLNNPRYQPQFRAVHETFSEMATLYEPFWKARDDVAKTIISIASGTIALTVTFSSSISSPYTHIFWKYLICAGWIFLLLSIVAAIASLWTSQNARKMSFTFFTHKSRAEQTSPEFQKITDEESSALTNELRRKITTLARTDVWAGRLLRVTFILFALGIISIGVIGASRL